MLLRKHLIGGRISDIHMLGLERLVQIKIETINEFNEIEVKTLVIELMGKHSNIILVNQNNIIIDAMRRINSNQNSYRNILPSHLYTLPTSNKFDFTTLKNFDDFYSKIKNQDVDLAKAISDTFTGFSTSFVQATIKEFGDITIDSPKFELNKIYSYFCDVLNNNKNLVFRTLYKNDVISDYVLTIGSSNEKYALNSFIDNFYFERETSDIFISYRNSVLKLILDVLKKYNNRLLNINSKLAECDDMDKYKLYGELITANLYRLNNTHIESVELENYYDNNTLISIPLDIKYSPSINAKHYFKKYNKLKNAFEIVSQQKCETELELNYIESIVYELENCSTLEDVQNIFEEISENVIFRERFNNQKSKKKKNVKKKNSSSFSPIEYNIDGYKIFVGRNNKENDILTFSFANKNDIWFHTKDIHGSHVILKADNSINEDILIKCAQIAAQHSKAHLSSNVPVDYCLVQFVKKPNGAKPGMVIFTNNKTLNVNPQDLKLI
jgi:predicted ribosome quality control (RQC) complex YloA/Tae2 family protein